MLPGFIWFVLALMMSLSSIFVGVVTYYYLQTHKNKKKFMQQISTARDIVFYYSIGMMFVVIFCIVFLMVFFGI
jgi:uncharacterized membrane protein YidH (DUF202 family)